MWVDKDDIFAEDKVREFKNSNPNARTHIRCLWKDGIPQFPLAPSSSFSSSYFAPHTLSMSDNGSDTAYEPRLSAHKSHPLRLTICNHDHRGPPTPPKSPLPLPRCPSALLPSQQLNLTNPRVSLVFPSPEPTSLGMQTALLWRREQLCTEQIRLARQNKERLEAGMIPISQTTSRILDRALEDVDQWSTAMDTIPPHLR